jgi:hypothetical protein
MAAIGAAGAFAANSPQPPPSEGYKSTMQPSCRKLFRRVEERDGTHDDAGLDHDQHRGYSCADRLLPVDHGSPTARPSTRLSSR